ncbi:MAG: hypothetical protein QM809_13430 [Gordonia sp. (in: high G+C Gram-positive bacteria)]|uniref:hypothetical protein n=1 Tax=Gordonia sp. (in: high G+C Gram-positive bacteria) TaxID=84139 RepID=UPI0039E4B4ED
MADAELRYALGAELCVTADNDSDVKPFYEQWSLHIRPGFSGVDDCYVTAYYYYEATGTLSRIARFEPHDRRLFLVEDTVYLYEDNELPHQSVDSAGPSGHLTGREGNGQGAYPYYESIKSILEESDPALYQVIDNAEIVGSVDYWLVFAKVDPSGAWAGFGKRQFNMTEAPFGQGVIK